MLPGFPGMSAVRLPAESPVVGRTLGQLSLRVRAGVSVMAIIRDPGGTVMPSPRERLQAGDVLTLAGTQEAMALAREIVLRGGAGLEAAYLSGT